MELTVLASSSKGNCYILQNKSEALVIEAGASLLEVKKSIDFNIKKIVGVIISHEHGDHSKFINQFIKNRIKVYASCGTIDSLKIEGLHLILRHGEIEQIGNFMILPFRVKHDAAEPLGFLINHEETGTILFATDTYYLPYKFNNIHNIMIECNHDRSVIEKNYKNGKIAFSYYNRLIQSHMDYDTCVGALEATDLKSVNKIILLHLSDENSNADKFKKGIQELTGKNVFIAEKGLVIDFNKTPF